jgi:hypothetical protein
MREKLARSCLPMFSTMALVRVVLSHPKRCFARTSITSAFSELLPGLRIRTIATSNPYRNALIWNALIKLPELAPWPPEVAP